MQKRYRKANWRYWQLALLLAMPLLSQVCHGVDYDSSLVTEFDPYYSNVGVYLSPVDETIPYIDSDDESTIYSDLLRRSLIPRDVVLEASIYPMPILGTLLREHTADFYDDMQFSDDFNLLKSVTLGFDEPYALSLFLGNVVKYRAEDIAKVGNNKGYMGYLFSGGSKHIKDNQLIDDNWGEFEWKIKGDREIDAVVHSWSFRVGGKWHDNEDISDIYYIGVRRSHLDFDAPVLAWLPNSGIDYQIAFSQQENAIIEQKLFFDKKLPLRAWKIALNIKIGFIWKQAEKYRGELATQGPGDEFYLVLRPDIEF